MGEAHLETVDDRQHNLLYFSHACHLKALSHGAIFLGTCNAILLLRDVTNVWYVKNILEVARKIAPCDRALNLL